MAGKLDLRAELSRPYDRTGFVRDVLRPVFGPGRLKVYTADQTAAALTEIDKKLVQSAVQYAELTLDDSTEVRCLEVRLQPRVRPEQSRVGIQALVRRLLTVGQAALVSFVPAEAETVARPWRFTLVAKDAGLNSEGKVVEQTNNARRYTYLLGPGQACRTPADRLRQLTAETNVTLDVLVKTFEVEVLSKEFFKEYKRHYEAFCQELAGSSFKKSVFKGDEKAIRDFVKKLLGRLVFLYFVQKKGWLGASSTQYLDGDRAFLTKLFHSSGGDATFYPVWLSRLFFETLNQDETVNPQRVGDAFLLPDGRQVCIPFLNGGLFDRDAHDHANYRLTLPPTLFHQSGRADVPGQRGFLDFLDSYNFTVQEDSPDEHVVAVDPEMLGNIFENLLEDNKDKGAFYTPKEIVHYMCRESLIEYLDTRLNVFEVPLGTAAGKGLKTEAASATKAGQLALTTTENRGNIQRRELEDFVREKHANAFIKQHAAELDKLLDTVKICDPAIGSGAFPMGLLHEIYLCKLVLKDLTQVQHSNLFHERDHLADPGRFHADVKLGIIQNSIYGVDIERGAVDIARLRFWLSLVVDEDRPRALPNLDYKIVVGNSLVSKLDGETLTLNWNLKAGTEREQRLRGQYVALGKLQAQFFTKAGAKKQQLQADIRNAKIDLLLAQVELELEKLPRPQATMFGSSAKQQAADLAVLTTRQGYETQAHKLHTLRTDATRALPYFDWRLDFPEVLNPHVTDEPGFDIVIGNPPYVQLQKMGAETSILEKAGYEVFNRTADVYCLFYELGVLIAKSRASLSYITSNKFIKSNYGGKTRSFLSRFKLQNVVDFGELPVFTNAATFPVILNLQKIISNNIANFTSVKKWPIDDLKCYVEHNGNAVSFIGSNSNEWHFEVNHNSGSISERMQNGSITLSKYVGDEIYRGVTTGFNDAFIINTLTRSKLIEKDPNAANIIKPLVNGTNSRKYKLHSTDEYLIFAKRGIKIDDYPSVKAHLLQFKNKLTPGVPGGRKAGSYAWYEIQDSTEYWPIFQQPKILYPDIALESRFSFDSSNVYPNATLFCIPKDDKYLLGVLNSKAAWFYLSSICPVLGDISKRGRLRLKTVYLNRLPIPSASDIIKNQIVSRVTKILAAKAADAAADTTVLEAEIDRLVYRLYGLKYDEVKLIDPAFAQTETEYNAMQR